MDAYLLKLTTWVVSISVALYWNRADINSADLAEGLWVGFSLYWLISAFRHRAVKEKEPWFEQLRHLLPMLVGFAFVFTTDLHFGPLGRRFVSRSGVSDIVGLWLAGAGLAFAIWARWHLGENWSAVVSIRSKRELIGTGLTGMCVIRFTQGY